MLELQIDVEEQTADAEAKVFESGGCNRPSGLSARCWG